VGVAPDKVDLEARIRAARILHERFRKVLEDIMEGKPPKLVIPKRTLANTVFDPKRGILLLGGETLEREFLDMGEARRFMQTLLMASIIYQALIENEYPTIRDLYYRGKHTIVYRDLRGRLREENTWDEQFESDAVIRDVEVYTGLLREDMLILSKEKGKVVGNMRIRSGGDIIDLSKLGHGAYAIESTPDLIEFIDWDAEFVLVVEKDAVFQQLHRIGFWKKYKAILVTGAGQPDRATRRFVRRLNEELGLPVYVLTDSIPGDEVVVARRPDGVVEVAPIEELLSNAFRGLERERALVSLEVPAWNPLSGRVAWSRVGYAYRHYVDGELVEIHTRGRGTVRATGGHTFYVIRDGRLRLVAAGDVKPGDYLIVARRLPTPGEWPRAPVIREGLEALTAWGAGGFTGNSGGHGLLLLADGRHANTAAGPGVQLRAPGRLIPEGILGGGPLEWMALLQGVYRAYGRLAGDGDVVLSFESEARAKYVFNVLLMLGASPTVMESGGRVEVRVPSCREATPPGVYEAMTGLQPPVRADCQLDGDHHAPIPGGARGLGAVAGGDVMAVEVSSVSRRRYSGYVYDLAVPGANTFTGSYGIVYHNSDPYGWYIYSVFKVGSIQLSYESERLATPQARFLGVSMTDVFGYGRKKPYLTEAERRNYIIKAKDADIKRAKELMNYSWFQTRGWRREIKLFLEKKAKLEIEALASKGLKFLAFKYIPEKIETGDWIE
jgi:DNA topoisomerase VI subunit A